MKTIATFQVHGTYGIETVQIYYSNKVYRFLVCGWRPMKFDSAIDACRKAATYPKFISFIETPCEAR